MEMKNYDYLCDSLTRLGFEGVFDKALKAAMQLAQKEFALSANIKKDDLATDFVFKFAQKEDGAFYFLNNVVASYTKGQQPPLTHDFFLYKQQGYDMRQMVNMLEGRSVHTEFHRDGRHVELWRRIDFTGKDERGNNLVRTTYVNNNKFNLKTELNKLPIQGMNAEDKQMLISALKNGDAATVVVKQGNNKENVNLVAMPHLGIIAALNMQGERVSLHNNMLKVVVSEQQPGLSDTTKQLVEGAKNNTQGQANDQTQSQGRRKAS